MFGRFHKSSVKKRVGPSDEPPGRCGACGGEQTLWNVPARMVCPPVSSSCTKSPRLRDGGFWYKNSIDRGRHGAEILVEKGKFGHL